MTEWNLAQDLPSECREASPRTVGHQSKFGQENGREVNHDNSNWRITKKISALPLIQARHGIRNNPSASIPRAPLPLRHKIDVSM